MKQRGKQARNRLALVIGGFAVIYAVIGGPPGSVWARPARDGVEHRPADHLMASRPDLIDRNGEILATDISTVSLYAEPRKIVDADEAVEAIFDRVPGHRHRQPAASSARGQCRLPVASSPD